MAIDIRITSRCSDATDVAVRAAPPVLVQAQVRVGSDACMGIPLPQGLGWQCVAAIVDAKLDHLLARCRRAWQQDTVL